MDIRKLILHALLQFDKMHLRALAREVNVHPNTIKKAVTLLEKEGILSIEKDDKLLISFAHTKKAHVTKRYILQLQILESNLLEYLNDKLFDPTILLFGSCAKGDMSSFSDIDLCIICDEPKELQLHSYQTTLKREIQVFMYTKDQFQKISKELKNNILNGIILQGFVKIYA